MQTILKLVRKPRMDDWSPLAKFYYADEALNSITLELESFDGRRDQARCDQLVQRLRQAQDRLIHIIYEMIAIIFPNESDRASRDYRVKFPDEIIHDSLPGQLWFGAECLAAGSNIVDRETESEQIRPIAKTLTKHLDQMRELLKDQSLRNPHQYTDKIKASLKVFDYLFAEFEFHYVSAMVPVKSVKEHDAQLDIAVLFSETLNKAMQKKYITQDQIDMFDPNVMFAIPRLAIVWGLLYYPEGALNVDREPEELSEMFRQYCHLLLTMRSLLRDMSQEELRQLEMTLVTGECVTTTPKRNNDNTEASTSKKSTYDCDKKNNINLNEKNCSLSGEDTKNDNKLNIDSGSKISPISTQTSIDDRVEINHDAADDLSLLEAFHNMNLPEVYERYEKSIQKKSRRMYKDRNELIHRLFVCIAGVADQLQTNYSQDVRKLLKMVLQPNEIVPVYEVNGKTARVPENEEETGIEVQEETLPLSSFIVGVRWVPDEECDQCTSCNTSFSIIRRRHHCRNCGRIFCSYCSSNRLALPELGYDKKVRVCDMCYFYKNNPTVDSSFANIARNITTNTFTENNYSNGGSSNTSSSTTATIVRNCNHETEPTYTTSSTLASIHEPLDGNNSISA
ncbi:Lateral signaling target protein 2 homolog [Strongyloides ratti]|uniref:Lateral signaling target protein 2 homolog n=1 Tax=Strongyloides ratti TaxID=34506 RepID=A0A090LTA1_STRRB|nr:Lateral signaling target protein 2 homolog [Strongyloides ratti]CEF71447.1 Lateral signaling target protein 2 homolog [Strongyloides ratti]